MTWMVAAAVLATCSAADWALLPEVTTAVDGTGAPTDWQAQPEAVMGVDPDTGQPTAAWEYSLPAANVQPHWFRFSARDPDGVVVGPSNVLLVAREWVAAAVLEPDPDRPNTATIRIVLTPAIVEP
jgi:hypothetical protein